MSKAEGDVSEAQKRLLELEQQKEELDKQLQQTQKAVLDGKQRTDKLLEEIRSRIEARTVSFEMSSLGLRLTPTLPCTVHIPVLMCLGQLLPFPPVLHLKLSIQTPVKQCPRLDAADCKPW